jgi:hypothetical protein
MLPGTVVCTVLAGLDAVAKKLSRFGTNNHVYPEEASHEKYIFCL